MAESAIPWDRPVAVVTDGVVPFEIADRAFDGLTWERWLADTVPLGIVLPLELRFADRWRQELSGLELLHFLRWGGGPVHDVPVLAVAFQPLDVVMRHREAGGMLAQRGTLFRQLPCYEDAAQFAERARAGLLERCPEPEPQANQSVARSRHDLANRGYSAWRLRVGYRTALHGLQEALAPKSKLRIRAAEETERVAATDAERELERRSVTPWVREFQALVRASGTGRAPFALVSPNEREQILRLHLESGPTDRLRLIYVDDEFEEHIDALNDVVFHGRLRFVPLGVGAHGRIALGVDGESVRVVCLRSRVDAERWLLLSSIDLDNVLGGNKEIASRVLHSVARDRGRPYAGTAEGERPVFDADGFTAFADEIAPTWRQRGSRALELSEDNGADDVREHRQLRAQVRSGLQSSLQAEGVACKLQVRGNDGLQHVVLLDLRLVKISSVEEAHEDSHLLREKLKRFPKKNSIPVIIYTASEQAQALLRGTSGAGQADDWVFKEGPDHVVAEGVADENSANAALHMIDALQRATLQTTQPLLPQHWPPKWTSAYLTARSEESSWQQLSQNTGDEALAFFVDDDNRKETLHASLSAFVDHPSRSDLNEFTRWLLKRRVVFAAMLRAAKIERTDLHVDIPAASRQLTSTWYDKATGEGGLFRSPTTHALGFGSVDAFIDEVLPAEASWLCDGSGPLGTDEVGQSKRDWLLGYFAASGALDED